MEEISLTPEQEADALTRDDDLGRLFAVAFAAAVPPFPIRQGVQEGGRT